MSKSIYFDFKKLKKDLKGMPLPEKIEHIWTYYKEFFLVAGVAITLVFGLIVSLFNTANTVAFGGMLSNITITNEGYNYMVTDFRKKLDLEKHEKVTIAHHEYKQSLTQGQMQDMYSLAMGLLAQVDNKTLDYMFMTQDAMEFFILEDIYLDLSTILTQEELSQFHDAGLLRYVESETQEKFPMALNVTNIPFVKEHLYVDQDVWLVFIANTRNPEICRMFWDHIIAWEPPAENS